jgi:hypothetical protein
MFAPVSVNALFACSPRGTKVQVAQAINEPHSSPDISFSISKGLSPDDAL